MQDRSSRSHSRALAWSLGLGLGLWACDGAEQQGSDAQRPVETPGSEAQTPAQSGDSTESPTTPGPLPGDTAPGGSQEQSGEEPETGAAACDFDAIAETDPVPLPASVVLGDFRVQIRADGGLQVGHVDSPGRTLFATPADTGPVEAAHVELEVEESQGSFQVSEEEQLRCSTSAPSSLQVSEQAMELRGGFLDQAAGCAGAGYRLRLCEAEPGHLAFSLSAEGDGGPFERLVLQVASSANEAIYGMGEQFPHDRLNLKGRAIPVLVQEGGIGRGHLPITPSVNQASPGSGGSEDSTYYAAAHYLTSELRSLFLENTEYARFDFRQDDRTRILLQAEQMRGRILQGESPLELIERFTSWAGRMPPLPAWSQQGAIVALARPLEESLDIVASLRASGASIAGVWNQTWSGVANTFIGEQVLWNWVQNPVHHPGWDGFVQTLEAEGTRVLCYVNPMFRDVSMLEDPVSRDLFSEGIAGDFFIHDAEGQPYMMPVTAFDVTLLDLSNEDARRWMKAVLREEVMGAGCSGWMADFAEALPFDARLASGAPASAWHNRYPVEWARLQREALEESDALGEMLVFSRSGHTRSPRHAMLIWEGDQLTTWDKYDGLVSALHGLVSAGLSGISLVHSDTGGYTSLSTADLGYSRESEQLKRWTEMNAFTALLRTHEGNQPGQNAQIYSDDEALNHFARFTKVYQALAFYRAQLMQEASEKGWPLVRHLLLHYPEDEEAWRVDDQFLLGSEILVAPIKNKCWTWPVCPYDKELYLPAGQWVHLWSGAVMGDDSTGGRVNIAAPIGEPAVFYRRGSEVGARLVQNLRDLGIDAAASP